MLKRLEKGTKPASAIAMSEIGRTYQYAIRDVEVILALAQSVGSTDGNSSRLSEEQRFALRLILSSYLWQILRCLEKLNAIAFQQADVKLIASATAQCLEQLTSEVQQRINEVIRRKNDQERH